MSGDVAHAGGCICGAVRYAVQGAASLLFFCHCTSCRRSAGAMMVAWGTFESANFRITDGNPGEVATSPGVTRGHCQRCGTSLTYQHSDRAGEIDVTLATLDDPTRLRPSMHIWVEDKLPWVKIGDDLPQYLQEEPGA
jgi:hypothetical protein